MNDYYTEEEGDRNLFLNRISVRSSSGQQIAQFELEFLNDIAGASVGNDCGGPFSAGQGSSLGGYGLYCQGFVKVPLAINAEDDYTVTVTAIGEQAGPDPIEMLVSITDSNAFGQSTGAVKIRNTLKQWHDRFFGETVDANGPEVARVYQLLANTWLQLNEMPDNNHFTNQACDFHDLPAADENGWISSDEVWIRITTDPFHMVGTWRLVLTYFLTDYRYIFE